MILTSSELASEHNAAPNLNSPRVLIFDSGVGGLSVMREIAARLPAIQLVYAADNAAFPYGVKPESELVARVSTVIRALVDRTQPDILVIACNTASTTALDAVRQFLSIPVIGVVPAVKPAAAASLTRSIGLLGTATTVASSYTQALIAEFAADCAVLLCGAPELVEMAELKIQGLPVDKAAIEAALARLFGQAGGNRIDQVVLGCTHFPLLVPELTEAAPHPVAWLDSGAAIARRVASLLGDAPVMPGKALPRYRAIFTADTGAVGRMAKGLSVFGLEEIDFLPI